MKICKVCKLSKPLEEFAKIKKIYYSSYCRTCNNKKLQKWYEMNKVKQAENSAKRYVQLRDECIQLLGSKCTTCGIKDARVLCIDHIEGGGAKERKQYGCGTGMLYLVRRKIKEGVHNYQLLCHNCNWIKALDNNEL